MMSLPRLSIRAVLFGVLLAAGDCAAWRLLGGYAPLGLVLGIFSVVPTSNIFAVASYRSLTHPTPRRPFLVGFGLAGALATLIWFNLFLMADEEHLTAFARWYTKALAGNVRYYLTTQSPFYIIICLVISLILFVASSVLPQVLVALSGGWIVDRFAARSRPSIPDLPPSP